MLSDFLPGLDIFPEFLQILNLRKKFSIFWEYVRTLQKP